MDIGVQTLSCPSQRPANRYNFERTLNGKGQMRADSRIHTDGGIVHREAILRLITTEKRADLRKRLIL